MAGKLFKQYKEDQGAGNSSLYKKYKSSMDSGLSTGNSTSLYRLHRLHCPHTTAAAVCIAARASSLVSPRSSSIRSLHARARTPSDRAISLSLSAVYIFTSAISLRRFRFHTKNPLLNHNICGRKGSYVCYFQSRLF